MEEQKVELKLIQMSDVVSEEIEWLWYPFIPFGKLTIVQGDPGLGKTTLVLNIAAKLSQGIGLDANMYSGKPLKVLYQTAEDGLSDTVKPRLEAAGAECNNIFVIDESEKSLSMIDERLEKAILTTGARLLILDPIQAYLGFDTDMNRANQTRELTKKLGDVAERTRTAIVLIGHMNKSSAKKAAYRGVGSIDFFATARSVLLVGGVEGKDNVRAVIQIKNNLAPVGHAKAFELTQSGFYWLGDYEITTEEILGGFEQKTNKLEQAKELLRELAKEHELIESSKITELAIGIGISQRTLDNAKKELGVNSKKVNKSWCCELEKLR